MSTSENKKEFKVFQILVDNNSGVLSRIAGLFSRRGYNIESITAGVTADPNITRITIMTSGDDDIMEQIERSEEHTSELQSPDNISYAVFCLEFGRAHV